MKYWFILNNKQVGPIAAEDLNQVDFNATTPAWHEGLRDWIPAGQIEALRAVIDRREAAAWSAPHNAAQATEIYTPQPEPTAATQFNRQPRRAVSSMVQSEERPSNYLVWAIISTLLCNLIFGIIAIIFASKVNPAFEKGDLAAARRNSERAQWFIIISIVLGVIWSPFQVALTMLWNS